MARYRFVLASKIVLIYSNVKKRLKKLLSSIDKRTVIDDSRIPTAVLVPLYYRDGQCHILFTRRTETVRTHKGQISFPGGVYQDEDVSLVNTALRESTEEIGLNAQDVEILGELDDEPSAAANYLITPFVGFIPWPYRFILSKDEVEEIIGVPVSELLGGGCRFQEVETLEGKVLSYAYQYQETVIWGATARILKQFLSIFTRIQPEKTTN
jgi:8-oxo-dGTP pyrophosphatase MutT (NUDIX family)